VNQTLKPSVAASVDESTLTALQTELSKVKSRGVTRYRPDVVFTLFSF